MLRAESGAGMPRDDHENNVVDPYLSFQPGPQCTD